MKPIEDPHQYPVQRGQRVRTAPRGRHLVDQVKGDQAIEPREARAEAKGEGLGRRVRKARGPRSGPLPVQDKFLITTTITDARRDELRARLETERLLDDTSPLVRGAAVWALARLADQDEIDRSRARHLPDEPDPDVRSEWESAAAASAA